MLEEMQSAYAASSQHLCDHGTNSSNACILTYFKCQLLHKCFTTFTTHMPTFTGWGLGQQSRPKMNESSRTLRQHLTCLPLSSSKMRKVGLSAITPGFEAPTHSFQCHKPAGCRGCPGAVGSHTLNPPMATKHAEVASRTSALITSVFSSTKSTRLSDFRVLPKTKFSAMWNAGSLQQAKPVEKLNSTWARTLSFSFLRVIFDFHKNHSQGWDKSPI